MHEKLSDIVTNWTEVFEAHNKRDKNLALAAQTTLLQRYASCIYRYLKSAVGDHDVVQDLAQDFALRFVRGDFRNANPNQGRFRSYLKTALRNLITDFKRGKVTMPISQEEFIIDESQIQPSEQLEQEFRDNWRGEILRITWESLREFENQGVNNYYTVLKARADNPLARSAELAETLSFSLDKQVTPDWVRQNLKRARDKFGRLLISEIKKTITIYAEGELESELVYLGLQKYCKQFIVESDNQQLTLNHSLIDAEHDEVTDKTGILNTE